MKDKTVGLIGLCCLVASAVSFWLWKLYIVRGPAVHALVWLFMSLFALALVSGLVLGIRLIFRGTGSWPKRGLLVAGLVGCEAYAALMAGLAMNFVGQ